MNSSSSLLALLVALPGLGGCQSQAKETPHPPVVTTTTLSASRVEGINAQPTKESGVYRLGVATEDVAQVRIVPKDGDRAEGRLVDAAKWSLDHSTGLLRVDVPVDDATETVIVLGQRARPPQIKLPEGVVFDSVRVVVGDRLGVEGKDYVLDRKTAFLRFLGTDSPENPLRYYVEATIGPDPAHPEVVTSVAFGNIGDLETIHRALGTETH